MFTALNLAIVSLWFLSAAVDYAEFCYLWQLKEYRLDRLRDFFSTKQGQRYWLRYQLLWRSLAVLVIFFWPFNQVITLKYILLLGFLAELIYNAWRLYRGRIRYPRPTAKAFGIVAAALLLEALLAVNDRDWAQTLVLVIVRFPLLSFTVIVFNKVTGRVKDWYIARAAKKIRSYPHLIVIGVTGSYGKSTVKEFLSQILAQKYSLVKTPRNTNTDIGIAQFILRTSFSGVQVFVVEMGAYRVGEIKKICDMVRPKVGILTAIIEQHLSLFGSIQNIQTAKYELLRSLPADGLAVVYADNPFCTEFLGDLTCRRVETYGLDPDNKPSLLITNIKSGLDGLRCSGVYLGFEGEMQAPVLGAHQALNIAPATMVAVYLGLTREQVYAGYRTLKAGENSLKIYRYGSADVIDDSYNSNPVGFKAALDIMAKFPSERERVVVTRGMLELGEKTEEYHEVMAEEIAFTADKLVLITPDFTAAIRRGIEKINGKYRLEIIEKYDSRELCDYLKQYKNKPAVILLENRVPKLARSELKSGL
ncbi:MAG: UDP-N-acetylmuramoyl-tripeptide-D-alanyl-D-alanine ligase [Candidatus Magasanikbacteria bacterium GW2011_GWA2_56_11]|uniref:UDP-N-acetylmuramoyl-tripeptide-D-alanyl-D-alanine ligase n=1 Tax=Candidatus Magasanikbacteria bacterium GW2011_GWA2_56_11 TaxID=1619044 RepID=A0A0G1YH23_9BACT|nr:MAG: UDP-N-acetylmuramoyl-tripeptide-D-alanyl-D-alanine ligase [Candidatus Magasanikbacteria bacterium GW2011_GWA2_56_11]